MSIRVLFFAKLAEITGMRETHVEASSYKNVGAIFSKFAGDFPALDAYRPAILYALNAEFAAPDASIRDGDEVAFLPPVSGG